MIISVKPKPRRKRNRKRKAFIRKRRRVRKPRKKKHIKQRLKWKKKITKARSGILFVKIKRRNIFMNISRRVKNNAINKFGQPTKKPYFRVYYAASMGHLKVYKGRGKTSAVARKALASLFLLQLLKNVSYS